MSGTRSHDRFRMMKRETRFRIDDLRCLCFVRNTHLRAATFEMLVQDISRTGLSLMDASSNCISFKPGDHLSLTLDIHRRIFDRPIHVHYRVTHAEVDGKDRYYGLEVMEIDAFHRASYEIGIGQLPIERSIDHTVFFYPTQPVIQETPVQIAIPRKIR